MTDLPEFIGPYKILDKLGEGGFATVYLAHADDLDETQPVALKVLSAPESYGRFQREVETIAQLEHPNIIRIFDAGEDDRIVASQGKIFRLADQSETAPLRGTLSKIWSGITGRTAQVELEPDPPVSTPEATNTAVPYFTMEYISGGTLRETLEAQSHLAIDDALEIIRQVGAALTYAHEQGIIHRDVNPNNILLDTSQDPPRPILTDFGLVKPLAPDDNLTMTVGLIGTFHYYAPEQWNRGVATSATDLYALAITFFEILSGRRPFRGDIFSLREQHLNDSVPLLSELAPRLGPFFDDILIKATAKDPADRYETVDCFLDALEVGRQALADDEKYKEIRSLMGDGNYPQALTELDNWFIQPGKYDYRDVTKLFWGVVHAKQHEGKLPATWDDVSDMRTRPLPEFDSDVVEQAISPQPPVQPKGHELNKFIVPPRVGDRDPDRQCYRTPNLRYFPLVHHSACCISAIRGLFLLLRLGLLPLPLEK